MSPPVYLDWNATTPPAPEVLAAMAEVAGAAWGNPASVHGFGRRARAHVEAAREAVAGLVGADPRDVVLTSGGTEANNLALRSAFPDQRGALLTSRLEHPSIVRVAEALAVAGVTVIWIEPEASGTISPESLARALDAAQGTARLISIQAVNHELGTLQPLAELSQLATRHGVPLHCDAVQAVGRVPSEVLRLADLVTVASHKVRGPKGAGALATRMATKLQPLLLGGAQEKGIRPGTQDPITMAGFACALARSPASVSRYAALRPLRDQLRTRLLELWPRAQENSTADGAPHLLNLSFPGWLGAELCAALDLEGVAVSSGSACSAGTPDPSPIISALHGEARARCAVRISLGETTCAADISAAISAFELVLARTSGSR